MDAIINTLVCQDDLDEQSTLLIQPDVIKENLTGTTGRCHIAFSAKTNSDPVNIGQIDTLIDKGL